MQRPYKLILITSVLITALLFWHDYVYDDPGDYSIKQEVFECIVFGSMYIGLIFGILSGLYFLNEQAIKFIGKIIRRKSNTG